VLLAAMCGAGPQAEATATAEKGGGMIDLATLVKGEIFQIDYDENGAITVLHVQQSSGERYEIRIAYPDWPMPVMEPGQRNYPIMRDHLRPKVSVVRLA
jgi:hypothetical protein